MSIEASAGESTTASSESVSPSATADPANPGVPSSTSESPVGKETPSPQSPEQKESLLGPDLIMGKFKTQADLEKAYENAEKLISGKFDAETVRKLAEEHNLFPKAPETYADLDKRAEALGLDNSIEGNITKFRDLAREHNLSQEAVDKFLDLHGEAVTHAYNYLKTRYGVDDRTLEQQQATLQKMWGDDFDSNRTAVNAWRKANIQPVIRTALGNRPEGMDLMLKWMKADGGPTPITEGEGSVADTQSLESRLSEIYRSDAFNNRRHKDNAKAHAEADRIIAKQLERAKKR